MLRLLEHLGGAGEAMIDHRKVLRLDREVGAARREHVLVHERDILRHLAPGEEIVDAPNRLISEHTQQLRVAIEMRQPFAERLRIVRRSEERRVGKEGSAWLS